MSFYGGTGQYGKGVYGGKSAATGNPFIPDPRSPKSIKVFKFTVRWEEDVEG